MKDRQQPSNDSPTPSSLGLESLKRLQRQQQMMTKATSPTPATKPRGKGNRSELTGEDGALTISKTNRTALANLEDAAGGRSELIDTLSYETLDQKQEHFVRLLADPAREGDSLACLARDAGLLPTQVIELFRHAGSAKAAVLAMATLHARTPAVMEDLVSKSIDAEVPCTECQGIGGGVDACAKCHGTGVFLRESDFDRQKAALEMAGLLKKSSGVTVQQNNVNVSAAPGSFFSRYIGQTDRAAYAIDAEVVKPEEK